MLNECVAMLQVRDVFQDRIKQIQTIQMMPTVLNQIPTVQRIEVYVTDPQVFQEKKLLKTTQTLLFRVGTPSFKWEVRRADTDFFFLHLYMRRAHPNLLLPPMPFSKTFKKEPKSLAKNARIFDRYLRQLLRGGGSAELRGNHFLVQFLSQPDRREFDNVIKQYSQSSGVQYGVNTLSKTTQWMKVSELVI